MAKIPIRVDSEKTKKKKKILKIMNLRKVAKKFSYVDFPTFFPTILFLGNKKKGIKSKSKSLFLAL